MNDREMIEHWLQVEGFSDVEWGEDDDGLYASLGRWRATEDDEDKGLYEGDEGELRVSIVGAEEYGNRRPSVSFHGDTEAYDVEHYSLEYVG